MDSADTSTTGGNLGSIDIIFGAQSSMKNPIWHPFALDNRYARIFTRRHCSEVDKRDLEYSRNTECASLVQINYRSNSCILLLLETTNPTTCVAPPSLLRPWSIDTYHYESFYMYFCILLQAILFYVPRWLWKNWEAGKIAALRMDLNLGIISEVEKKLKKKLLIEYMYTNLKHHNFWAYRYFFCELLSLINVGGKKLSFSRWIQINVFFISFTASNFSWIVLSFKLYSGSSNSEPN